MPRRVLVRITLLASLCMASSHLLAAPYETVILNGPPSNRVDMVILGDGYTAGEINTVYAEHIQALIDRTFHSFEDPFPRYHKFFNFHRVDVVSNESGVDIPFLNIYRDTAFDGTYGADDQVPTIDHFKAWDALNAALAGAGFSSDITIVTVNTDRGGGTAPPQMAVYAGGGIVGPPTALHEIGHSFSHLADEYVRFPDEVYQGPEFPHFNITISPLGEKWARWHGYVDPDHPDLGQIGAYEGGSGVGHGVYRPSFFSKMSIVGLPFDAVSREKIILDMYAVVDPLDDWLANNQPLIDPASLWVDVIDPNVIQVQWYLDGQLLAGISGESLSLPLLSPGDHVLAARAFDDTPWVRLDSADLEQWVTWNVVISGVLGDYNRNGVVDAPDYVVWRNTLGLTGIGLAADGNGDGTVDHDDYNVWTSHFGQTAGSGAGSAAHVSSGDGAGPHAAVPEPASWLLLGSAAAMTTSRRRRLRLFYPVCGNPDVLCKINCLAELHA